MMACALQWALIAGHCECYGMLDPGGVMHGCGGTIPGMQLLGVKVSPDPARV